MRVLVTGATKGGVGKTTLAVALAVEGCRRGKKVGLIDLDPQQSAARWHELRQKQDSPQLLELGRERDLERVVTRHQDSLDWLIVDTPPALIRTIEPAIAAADLVLIPVRASPIDVESVDAIMEMAIEHKRDFVFVLNATTARSKLNEGARAYLNGSRKSAEAAHRDMVGGDVLEIEIVNRLLYASAMLNGRTAAELEPKGPAAAEIAALWTGLEKRVERSKKQARR